MMTGDLYPLEVLGEDEDDGTMPANVAELTQAIVGRRIVGVERSELVNPPYGDGPGETVLTLDDGRRVRLLDQYECCASTELEAFLLCPEMVDHIITGVGTTDGYTTWHIYADAGDVLELTVGWSCGNPFYYLYGFQIRVES